MPPAILTQVAAFGFVYEGEGAFADLPKFSKHCFFFAYAFWIQWNGRFSANQSGFHQREGKMKSF